MSELHDRVAHILTLEDQARAMNALLDRTSNTPRHPKRQQSLLKILWALRSEQWRLIYDLAGTLPDD